MGNATETLFGPTLVGVFLNCILYGVLATQVFVYFQAYGSKDEWWIRLFVAYLLFCETINTACDMAMLYGSLITRNGTIEAITYAPIMLTSEPIIAVMVSLPVQLFTAWRIKVLSQSTILPIIITILSVVSFVGGIANAVLIAIIRKYIDFPRFKFVSIIWLLTSAVADIVVTAILVFSLLRRRIGIGATDHPVGEIILLTVQTGFITAAFAILNAAVFMSIRGRWTLSFIYDFSLSKLYSNSLLFTLNARCSLKPATSARDNVLFGSEEIGPESPEVHQQMRHFAPVAL